MSTCRTSRGGWGQRAGIDQSRNLGRPGRAGKVVSPNGPREYITKGRPWPGVGEAHTSEEAVTPVEQRGLTENLAAVRGKENRLDENPITEEWELIEALRKQASGDGLEAVRTLRRTHRPPDAPAPCSPVGSILSSLSVSDSAGPSLPPRVWYCRASGNLSHSASSHSRSSSMDCIPGTSAWSAD